MSVKAVIGKNFGDEGKGLATDHLAMLSEREFRSCIVVRHNGGAQAGHTVEALGKRYVFKEISSGSFRGADTFWAPTFMPDLYKLSDERDAFLSLGVHLPEIYSDPGCPLTYIDDILINMSLESRRGKDRHGSCGMGIDEAKRRSLIPEFRITPGDIASDGADAFYQKLLYIRREYLPKRLEVLSLDPASMGEYGELISDGNVLLYTREDIAKSISSATSNYDIIRDIEADGDIAGRLIVHNPKAELEKQTNVKTAAFVAALTAFTAAVTVIYYVYLNRRVLEPFRKLKNFAVKVAGYYCIKNRPRCLML